MKFDGNGADNLDAMEDQEFRYDVIQKLNVNKFTKAGYTFVGWNTQQDESGTWYADEDEIIEGITTDKEITLYAIWELENNVEAIAIKTYLIENQA